MHQWARAACAFSFAAVVLVPATSYAFEVSQEFKTRINNSIVMTHQTDGPIASQSGRSRDEAVAEQSWRLMDLLKLGDEVNLDLAYQLGPQIASSRSLVGTVGGPVHYRVIDLEESLPLISDTPGFRFPQNLDRLALTVTGSSYEAVLGRQAISFGVTKMLDVEDVVSPFPFASLDKEYKAGVDGVRFRIPIGQLDEVDFGMVGGRDSHDESELQLGYARVQMVRLGTTWSAMALGFKEHAMFAASASGAVADAGVWVDGAVVLAGLREERVRRDDYTRITVGVDTKPTAELYVACEYGYNGAGTNDAEEFLARTRRTAYRDGAVSLLGVHHLALLAQREITARLSGDVQALTNVTDGSLQISPSLAFDAADSWDLVAGANWSLGERSKESFPGVATPQSEFGMRPDWYYASTRMFF